MASPCCERAVTDALRTGRALLKYISCNDAGLTGSHQCGFYLPLAAWELYSPQRPTKNTNHKSLVTITWQDGRTTESAVTWYGKGTRHEYRLTRFGRDFPFLDSDAVGNLLVLIPETLREFRAYVLGLDEDIEEVQAALGVEVMGTWGVYEYGQVPEEDENDCIDRHFREFAAEVADFPAGEVFSATTWGTLLECIADFADRPFDDQLIRAVEAEYALFRMVERRLCESEVGRLFASVDDFLWTAKSIMNRRKSRAGRSFENHMEIVLRSAGVPCEVRPPIDGRPDLVIPDARSYHDPGYPVDRLFIVGLKTTCKDRWRQILNEGKRVSAKHLITLQRGISAGQLAEMASAGVSLVVPDRLHRDYPTDSPMNLKSVDSFISEVKRVLACQMS